MPVFETEKQIDNLLDVYTKADEDERMTHLEEINKELEEFLSRENNCNNTRDGVFDFPRDLQDSVQQELDKLLADDNDKKRFIMSLSRIVALLLNTKVDTAEKTKCIIKIAIETTLEIWQEPRPQ